MTNINLKNVAFGYSETLFQGVNLDVARGDILAISGKAGVGKTSLLKISAGILMPTSGSVFIEGKDVWGLNDAERTLLRNNIAFYFQEGALIANMNIFDNLALRLRYHSSYSETEIQKNIGNMLDFFELTKYKTSLPASLTLDLRRRVSLVRTLITVRPKAYFWDDVDDLDERSIKAVEDFIKKTSRDGIPNILVGNESRLLALSNRKLKIEGERVVE